MLLRLFSNLLWRIETWLIEYKTERRKRRMWAYYFKSGGVIR